MPKIHLYPFLRLLLPLVIGFFIGFFFNLSTATSTLLIALLFTFVAYLPYYHYLYKQYKLRWLSGMIPFLFLIIAGQTLYQIALPTPIDKSQKVTTLGEILNIQASPSGWDKVVFRPQFRYDSTLITPNEKWLLTVKHEITTNFEPHDKIVVKGTLQPLEGSTNPNSFNYGLYLIRNGFSAQMFVSDENSLQLVKRNESLKWGQIPQKVRENCVDIFIKSGVDSTSISIIKAMLLGDRSDIDKEVNQQFVQSGVVHILAVSGLHVGIFFLVINSLLSLFLKPKSFTKSSITIFLLLGYAFITGFSPSVSRAVLMFSLIQIGTSSKREVNKYQLIGLSAFILLLIQPTFIFHMGFWLSHLAVVGIIAYYPIIYRWLYFKFPVWRWAWSIISVSLSAQLSTFPLSIFVFGTFPLYFLLANILVLPAVAPILIIALLILALSPFPFVTAMLSGAINDLIHYIINCTEWVHSLPSSYLNLLWVSTLLMFTLYMILLYIYQNYLEMSSRRLFILGSWIVVALIILNVQYFFKTAQSGIVVYDTSKGLLIDLFHQGNAVTIESNNLTLTDKSFARDGIAKKLQLKSENIIQIPDNTPSIQKIKINNRLYFLVSGFPKNTHPQLNNEQADGIIIRNSSFDIEHFAKKAECPLFIAASENRAWEVRKWETSASKINSTLHSTRKDGAISIFPTLKAGNNEVEQ